VLVLPLGGELSTAAVYAQLDRSGLQRTRAELSTLRTEIASALARGAPLPAATELLHNDLQHAAVSLCPEIAEALADARRTGAEQALVSGSGPTALGLFAPPGVPVNGSPGPAAAAAELLAGRVPAAIAAMPVGADFGRPVALAG
jgi:4-diphosphocytidyl-2-C-methyl-D-erythritol kinase